MFNRWKADWKIWFIVFIYRLKLFQKHMYLQSNNSTELHVIIYVTQSVKKYLTPLIKTKKAINIECFSNCKKFKSQLSVSAADLLISIVNCLVLEMQVISVPSVVGPHRSSCKSQIINSKGQCWLKEINHIQGHLLDSKLLFYVFWSNSSQVYFRYYE